MFFLHADLLPGNPLVSDTPCNCAVNQVCLRVGRFGEFRCVDCRFRYINIRASLIIIITVVLTIVLSEGERCDSGRYNDDNDDKDDEGSYACMPIVFLID